ncbi:MAG: hypothetical protein ACYCP0_07955 [Acidiferrobacteraceae bacterium]
MTEPVSARADRFRIADLLHLTDARVHDSFTAPAAALGKYGLTTPVATVWLNHQKIEFGDENALGGLQYVLYRGRVDLIPSYSFKPPDREKPQTHRICGPQIPTDVAPGCMASRSAGSSPLIRCDHQLRR